MGNGGYDVRHYDIDIDVDPVTNTISAQTTITAEATGDLTSFNLDLSGLEVHAVTVDGAPAEFSRSAHELTVRPSQPLTRGTIFSARVSYSGTPETINDPGFPSSEVGWRRRDGVIYTESQPSGSMGWFPSNNHPSDKATFEIEIAVPEGLIAASNGRLVDQITREGRTTFTWRMVHPMATYLAAVYIGDFDRVEHGRLDGDGPLLRHYLPSDAEESVTQALSVIPDAIRFLEDLLGPYPFDAYGVIVMPFRLSFALENQTLSLHGPVNPSFMAHEAAHQWLGNSVSLDDWSDIWLNEGFATYLHKMFVADRDGTDFNASMEKLHARLPGRAAIPPKGIDIGEMFHRSVYDRGAMTLHALRLHAGDDVFFKILRMHYERSAGGTTNTAEFLGIVDEFAGSEAVALVKSWLTDKSVPALP